MCSKTERVIELLYMPETISRATDKFLRRRHRTARHALEHMFDIRAKWRYIRPYER
jgi:hypothetical protein